jgi:hypothetical protein
MPPPRFFDAGGFTMTDEENKAALVAWLKAPRPRGARVGIAFRTDLEGANLKGANLERANLKGANLEGANLEGASFTGATMPDGTKAL